MQPTENKKLTRKEKIAAGIPKPYKGNRKALAANQRKEIKGQEVRASLIKQKGSPRKYRLLADVIRGESVEKALAILQLSNRAASKPIYKLLLSAINNYEKKTEKTPDFESVYVDSLLVNGGAMLKRIRPAPQGRAYRVRKRYCHVHLKLNTLEQKSTTIATEE